MRKLSGPSPRAEIGVSFDSSAGTVAALESLLDLGGRTSDGENQPIYRFRGTAAFLSSLRPGYSKTRGEAW